MAQERTHPRLECCPSGKWSSDTTRKTQHLIACDLAPRALRLSAKIAPSIIRKRPAISSSTGRTLPRDESSVSVTWYCSTCASYNAFLSSAPKVEAAIYGSECRLEKMRCLRTLSQSSKCWSGDICQANSLGCFRHRFLRPETSELDRDSLLN